VYDGATPAFFRNLTPRRLNGASSMVTTDTHECVQSTLWTVAYKRYYRLWVNLALTVHFNVAEAEDVVHAVIQSAMTRDGEPFASLEHIRNYVAKSVLNRAGQNRARESHTMRWDEHAELLSRVAPSSEELEDREQVRILREALVRLNPRDYEIVKLRFFLGLTFQEIADYLGLALSTVKSREESALKRIRKALRKNGVEGVIIRGRQNMP
jgi:RNA polymerase sigma factor (sigma-70 family)